MKPFTKRWWEFMTGTAEGEAMIQFKLGNSKRAHEVIEIYHYCKKRATIKPE